MSASPLSGPQHSLLVSALVAPSRASAPTWGYHVDSQVAGNHRPREKRLQSRSQGQGERQHLGGKPRQTPERVSQLHSGISFCHAESTALGQQNKEAREKAPLCLCLNARPAGKEGFPRARDEASQACLLGPGLGPKPGSPSSYDHPECPQHSVAGSIQASTSKAHHRQQAHRR